MVTLALNTIACLLISLALLGCRAEVQPLATPTAQQTQLPQSVQAQEPVSTTTPLVEQRARLEPHQVKLLEGARSTIGDLYDDAYYGGGPPPDGRGACTDVVYDAFLRVGLNLQDEIEKDIAAQASGYPNLGDRNINYRRAPNLIVWFERHIKSLPVDSEFQAGDVVFWSLANDGVADHVGVVSDKPDTVIHNFPPRAREDGALKNWVVLGHFRWEPGTF